MIHRLFKSKLDAHGETIWLTIYADLMTNLLLVFLALYGLTVMGKDAIQKAMESMTSVPKETSKSDLTFDTLAPILRARVGQDSEIAISEEAGAVRIEFGETVLFESGRAILKPTASAAMKKISDVLGKMPRTIVVEGHTDSIPLHAGGKYRDNWELSLARSMAVVNLLIKEAGFSPDHLAAAAYGSVRPRADNTSEFGRRINRRVEIALFRDFPYEIKPGLEP